MENEQSASINEKSDEEIVKENEERKEKEKKERNREYQRAWRQRQKDLKKKKKDSKEEKRNDLQMKRKKLDRNEDQENVVQCRATQNLENVQFLQKKKEDERKRKQKNKEYCKRYRDKKRTSNLQTGPSAREVLDVQLDDLQMKRRKLDSNEDQENVVQCRATQNLENVQLEQNQFLTQQLRIYEESHSDDAIKPGSTKWVQYSTCNPQNTDNTCKPQDTDGTSKLQDTEDTSQPQNTEDTSKPQNTEDTSQPQNTEDTSKPQDVEDTCKPRGINETSKPQDTDNNFKPQKNILNPFPCNICKLRFPSRLTLNTHLLSHEYECHMCKKDFGSKKLFLNHIRVCKSHDTDNTYKLQNTDSKFKAQTQKDVLNPFSCHICKIRFLSRQTLNTHILSHEYVCQTCKIYCGSKNLFLKHKCWLCKTCNKPCESFDHTNCPKYSCKMCNETFEDSLAATSHSRTHGTPMRSYTRKPKAVNTREKIREPVNIVKVENLSDVPIEFDGDPEPQERVIVKDGHEEGWLAEVKKEPVYKRSSEDLGGVGMTEPKLRCVKVELDVAEETRNPNQKGLYTGETSKHLGGVKVEPDLKDEPNDSVDVLRNTSTHHEPPRDEDTREAVDKVDVVVTEESSKVFQGVKIEPEVRLEIKKEPNERFELDEVMDEEQDVKAEAELYAGHQIVDGIAVGPVRVRAPTVYAGKNAMTAGSGKCAQYSTCNPQEADDTCKPQDTHSTSKSQQDTNARYKPHGLNDTRKPQAIEDTCKPQDTDNKCKLQQTIKKILNISNICNICKIRFTSRDILNTHLLSHKYTCKTCKIDLSSKNLFLKHKCCVCKTCNKPYARSNHKKCRKVYTCKCGETFTRYRGFINHQKIHVEIFESCPACCKQFTKETDLINHVNEMKFPCIYCGFCFPSLEELSAHNVVQPDLPKYRCKMSNETFEDSLAATSHSRTHGTPMRSYTRKPKAVNTQEKIREPVNIVKEENLSDVPIELDEDPEPRERVIVKDGHEERWLADVKKEPCYQRSSEDLGEVGMTEPKLRCVEVDLDVAEETRNPNQKGLYTGETSKHLGGVKVEPDLKDEPNESVDVVSVVYVGRI